jgi:hypothetical protein
VHLRLLCICVLIFCSAGCFKKPAPPSPSITIEHELSPDPPRTGPVVLILRLADSAAKAVTQAHIVVEADMSHPGMAPVFTDAKEIEPGRYRAQLTFEMAGDWVILLHITLPGGKNLERQIDVRGVRAN